MKHPFALFVLHAPLATPLSHVDIPSVFYVSINVIDVVYVEGIFSGLRRFLLSK
jgi:hypothetical protein